MDFNFDGERFAINVFLLLASTYAVAWTGSSVAGNPLCQVSATTQGVDTNIISGGISALNTANDVTIDASSSTALADLSSALAGDSARIIRINGVIDFTGSAGVTRGNANGCVYSENSCSIHGRQERILQNAMNYCAGRQLINVDYDTAAATPLKVGSNKTLIGIGASSGIKGKGIAIWNQRNVVVRNLHFSDINEGVIWAGDAIQINNASNIWIDHNYFARVGRQFIAAGTGSVINLKVSNNKFDGTSDYGHYCDGRHYWNLLIDTSTVSATIANNWFYNTSGRAPQVETPTNSGYGGLVQVVNNYYSGNSHIGIASSPNVLLVVEGNYFLHDENFFPIYHSSSNKSTRDLIFAPLSGNAGSLSSACLSVLGRDCAGNYDGGNQSADKVSADRSVFSTYISSAISTVTGLSTTTPAAAGDVPASVQRDAGPLSCVGS